MKSKTSVWLKVIESLQELAEEEGRQFSLAVEFAQEDKGRLVVAENCVGLELCVQTRDGEYFPVQARIYDDSNMAELARLLAREVRFFKRAPLPRKKGTKS